MQRSIGRQHASGVKHAWVCICERGQIHSANFLKQPNVSHSRYVAAPDYTDVDWMHRLPCWLTVSKNGRPLPGAPVHLSIYFGALSELPRRDLNPRPGD